MPFEVVAKTAEMLGLVCVFGPRKTFSKATDIELAEAGARGFDALLAGHDGINAALKLVQERSQNINAGHYTDFGHFARWLERMVCDLRYEPIREIYRDFVFQEYPIAKGDCVLGKPCPKRHLHSFATISNEFDINPIRLKNFLWGYGFARGERTAALNTQEIGYFDAVESETRIQEIVGVVDRVEAARRLNVNRCLFDRLRKLGIIKPVADFQGLKGLYKPDHLDDVLRQVLGRAQTIEDAKRTQLDFGVACNKAKVTVEDVLPLILNGNVEWIGCRKGAKGFAGLMVDIDEILDLFEGPPLIGYTKRDLKRMLRVNDPTVTHLMKCGFINGEQTRHPRSRRPMTIVSEDAYSAFVRRFVTLGILAHQLGTQAKHVATRLDKMGIYPMQLAPRFSKIYKRENLQSIIDDDGSLTNVSA